MGGVYHPLSAQLGAMLSGIEPLVWQAKPDLVRRLQEAAHLRVPLSLRALAGASERAGVPQGGRLIVYGVHPIAELLGRAAAREEEWTRAARLLVGARQRCHPPPARAGRRAGHSGSGGDRAGTGAAVRQRRPSRRRAGRYARADTIRVALAAPRGRGAQRRRRAERAARRPCRAWPQRSEALVAVADGITDPANLASVHAQRRAVRRRPGGGAAAAGGALRRHGDAAVRGSGCARGHRYGCQRGGRPDRAAARRLLGLWRRPGRRTA